MRRARARAEPVRRPRSRWICLLLAGLVWASSAAAQTPIAGHYPPGQSGIRGAAAPPVGWAYTNFSRFFSNLEVKDAEGAVTT
ncbi:MAG TPA: hypothetical protein VFQ21_11695, partial [Gemmatimonadota bacterium]|nr:hypothetical protein [Gemmatimonadota bacterium]